MRSLKIQEDEFRYNLPDDEWLVNKLNEFEEFLTECKKKLNMEDVETEINKLLMMYVFVRIDQRKDYFMYFHSENDSMHMSLEKEIALEAYWISKYQPLRIKSIEEEVNFFLTYRVTISDVIAAMLIIAFLIDYDEKLDDFFDTKRINTLVYDIFNRDISKEAMIMYVESFIKEEKETC